ncbi:MAG: BrnT family toxin [Lachnospiraceae bacterium]|nr:BrnT family toxin [Lachnospiraceae bacterium]
MKFEWDEEKAAINFRKHGIRFETAIRVFQDERRIERYDYKHSLTEDRYITIGKVGKVLFVVFVERGRNVRIISARLATRKEEAKYYGNSVL